MNEQHIIGSHIAVVRYSEVNDPEGRFCFDGFDTVDCGVHISMANGYWWNFRWTEEEFFEVDEGLHTHPEGLEQERVKTWDATAQWERYKDLPVSQIIITYYDEPAGLVERCTLVFENGARVTLLIAEEMEPGATRPEHVGYDMQGHLYIFHDQRLLEDLETGPAAP